MTFPQRRRLAWALLLAFAAAGAGWLARLDLRQKISTDVLDLLPADERNPEVAIVRELASSDGETEVSWREGRRHVARLVRASSSPSFPGAAP